MKLSNELCTASVVGITISVTMLPVDLRTVGLLRLFFVASTTERRSFVDQLAAIVTTVAAAVVVSVVLLVVAVVVEEQRFGRRRLHFRQRGSASQRAITMTLSERRS